MEFSLKFVTQCFDLLAFFLTQPSLFLLLLGKKGVQNLSEKTSHFITLFANQAFKAILRFGISNSPFTTPIKGGRIIYTKLKAKRLQRQFFSWLIQYLKLSFDYKEQKINYEELQKGLDSKKYPLVAQTKLAPVFMLFVSPSLESDNSSVETAIVEYSKKQISIATYLKTIAYTVLATIYFGGYVLFSGYILYRFWSWSVLWVAVFYFGFQIAFWIAIICVIILVVCIAIILFSTVGKFIRKVVKNPETLLSIIESIQFRNWARLTVLIHNPIFEFMHFSTIISVAYQWIMPLLFLAAFILLFLSPAFLVKLKIWMILLAIIGLDFSLESAIKFLGMAIVSPLGLVAKITMVLIAKKENLPNYLLLIGILLFVIARILSLFA